MWILVTSGLIKTQMSY